MGPCKHFAPSPVLANEGCRLQWLGTKPQQPAASQKTPNCMQSMESSPEKYCPKTAKSLHCSFPKDEYLTKMLLTPVIHSVHLTLLCQRFQQRPARANLSQKLWALHCKFCVGSLRISNGHSHWPRYQRVTWEDD